VVSDQTLLVAQVDGTPGTRGDGIAGVGVVIRRADGRIVLWRSLRAHAKTCNEAEYQAVIAALRLLLQRFPGRPVRCLSDSRVVVDQVCGRCAVRAGSLQPLYAQARRLMEQFPSLEMIAIPHELNRLADALAWEALYGYPGEAGTGNR
jgi:ribonuclease HI